MADKEQIEKTVAAMIAFHDRKLIAFGDELAKREGYKEHLALDAVHFFLMNKHGWLPEQVKSMSKDDLRFCLKEEMYGFNFKE